MIICLGCFKTLLHSDYLFSTVMPINSCCLVILKGYSCLYNYVLMHILRFSLRPILRNEYKGRQHIIMKSFFIKFQKYLFSVAFICYFIMWMMYIVSNTHIQLSGGLYFKATVTFDVYYLTIIDFFEG